MGKQVAELYQKLAVYLHSGEKEYFENRNEIIRKYKAENRHAEIQRALDKLENDYKSRTTDTPGELCWLDGTNLEDYLNDADICCRFARRNREKIAEIILNRIGMTGAESFHTVHNYSKREPNPISPKRTGSRLWYSVRLKPYKHCVV